ncbi:MAG: hypothetical protein ABIL58_19260 [Pseudomonadota bacterium]
MMSAHLIAWHWGNRESSAVSPATDDPAMINGGIDLEGEVAETDFLFGSPLLGLLISLAVDC